MNCNTDYTDSKCSTLYVLEIYGKYIWYLIKVIMINHKWLKSWKTNHSLTPSLPPPCHIEHLHYAPACVNETWIFRSNMSYLVQMQLFWYLITLKKDAARTEWTFRGKCCTFSRWNNFQWYMWPSDPLTDHQIHKAVFCRGTCVSCCNDNVWKYIWTSRTMEIVFDQHICTPGSICCVFLIVCWLIYHPLGSV